MAVSPSPTKSDPPPDWLPRATLWPSILSAATHLFLLLLTVTFIRSCERAPVGFTDRIETGEIGIVLKNAGDQPDAVVEGEPRTGSNKVTSEGQSEFSDGAAPGRVTSDEPPVETSLPQGDSKGIIGPGVSLPGGNITVTDPRQPVKSAGGQRRPATGHLGGPRGAAFMGTRDEGTKIIFVVDASGSMSAQNSMQVAKAALISSIQSLEENQQFLVIFYDDDPTVLNLKNVSAPQLYPATELHKTLARQKIASIKPGTGTQHVPALEMALNLHPDVIFFLTDAQEPTIYPGELAQLKQLNSQKTRIHAIEFGVGPEVSAKVSPNNFLRRLSQQNGGTYRYHDVTKFEEKTNHKGTETQRKK